MGFCILDLSKRLVSDFHHNPMKSLYGDKLRVCFSDNDSFLNLIETEDLYEDMKEYEHLFNTSDFPKQYVLYSKHNKKVLGKFKKN